MYILTNEIKDKLVKDLKRNVRFDNMSFHFENNFLVCFSTDYGFQAIGFNQLPTRYSYTKLLKNITESLYDLIQLFKDAQESLKTIPYSALLDNTRTVKKSYYSKDVPYQYEKDGIYYHYIIGVHSIKDIQSMGIYITKDILDAHSKDEHTFFEDVSSSYQERGKNIITDSFISY